MSTRFGSQALQALLLIALSSATLSAAVVPGRWDKVDALARGSEITVELKSGDLLPAKFLDSTPDSVTIQPDAGSELALPKESIARVVEIEPRSNKSGLLGVAIGGGAGFAIGAVMAGDEGYAFMFPLVLGLTGAAAGGLIGHYAGAGPQENLLYLAP